MSRPEHLMSAEYFYNAEESKKYSENSRIISIQTRMANRCIELLDLDNIEKDKPLLFLDIGCGSGISTNVIESHGYFSIGMDISAEMLNTFKSDCESEALLGDIGQGLPFNAGTFDYAISVSVIQWLCYNDKKNNNPYKRLNIFFKELFKVLKQGGKAVLQFYPENKQQIEEISNAAIRNGFFGGVFIDFPNSSKAKKYYLIICNINLGRLGAKIKLEGSDSEDEIILSKNHKKEKLSRRSKKIKKEIEKGKFKHKSKLWIFKKKENQRKLGDKTVKFDSNYTGRKRKSYL